MAKRYRVSRIKGTLSYSTMEIAELLGIHRRTVQLWYRAGLPGIDSKRPFLVRGTELKAFLSQRQAKRKHRCRPGEFYCLKCRAPQRPMGKAITITILNGKQAMAAGRCCQCGTKMNRAIALNGLSKIKELFVIDRIGYRDLLKSSGPVSNTDLSRSIENDQI